MILQRYSPKIMLMMAPGRKSVRLAVCDTRLLQDAGFKTVMAVQEKRYETVGPYA
jgi:LSD1 subclass zinc finger protein